MNAYTLLHLRKGTCVLIFQSSLSGIEDAVFKWASEIIKYLYWTMLSYHQCQIRNDMYDKSFLIVFQYSVTSLSPLVPPPPRPFPPISPLCLNVKGWLRQSRRHLPFWQSYLSSLGAKTILRNTQCNSTPLSPPQKYLYHNIQSRVVSPNKKWVCLWNAVK